MMAATEPDLQIEPHSLETKTTQLTLDYVARTAFARLPNEILVLITEHTEPDDLANLRLTNKAFCTVCTKPFGISRLAYRRFVVTRKGLQSLCDLAAHPVFRLCVRSILLSTHRLSKDCLKISKAERPPPTADEDWTRHNQLVKFTASKQANLFISRQHIVLLTQALKSFKECGNSPTLGIYDDSQRGVLCKGHGFEEQWGWLSPAVELKAQQWVPRRADILRVIVTATRLSGFPLGDLELELSTSLSMDEKLDIMLCEFMTWEDEVDDQVRLRRDINICFKLGKDQELRLINIDEPRRSGLRMEFLGKLVGKWRRRQLNMSFNNHLARSAADHLFYYHFEYGSIPHLTPACFGELGNLFIPGSGVTADDPTGQALALLMMRSMVGATTATRFREIRLQKCAIRSNNVLNLLTGHCNHIKKLELVDVRILMDTRDREPDESEHFPFFYRFRDILHKWVNLESLSIKNLMCDDYDLIIPITVAASGREWHGVEEVRKGWDDFIAELKKRGVNRRQGIDTEWSGSEFSEDDSNLDDDSELDDEDDSDDGSDWDGESGEDDEHEDDEEGEGE